MRGRAIGVALMLSLASNVDAKDANCSEGRSDVFKLLEWSASVNANGYTDINYKFRNDSSQTIKMVDGAIWFKDALGGSIGGISLNRDHRIAPKGEANDRQTFYTSMARLMKVDKGDVRVAICVRSVLYDTGETAKFD